MQATLSQKLHHRVRLLGPCTGPIFVIGIVPLVFAFTVNPSFAFLSVLIALIGVVIWEQNQSQVSLILEILQSQEWMITDAKADQTGPTEITLLLPEVTSQTNIMGKSVSAKIPAKTVSVSGPLLKLLIDNSDSSTFKLPTVKV